MCVLRASGEKFDVDEFLRSSSLKPCAVHRRSEAGPRGAHEASGLSIAVSGASWSNLAAQVADAERFIATHAKEIRDLVGFRGVEEVTLDFPLDLRVGAGVAAQFDRFPPSLVRAAGELGLGLELSLYPVAPEPTTSRHSARRSAGRSRSAAAR